MARKTLKDQTPGSNRNAKRREIITTFYTLIRGGVDIKVFNESLQKDIYITKKSMKETRAHAAVATNSTDAVFKLFKILKDAKKIGEEPIKAGNKSQSGYKKIIILADKVTGIGEVKLTVGVTKDDSRHIQYCLTALE